MPRASKTAIEETGFYDPYSYYSRTLRTWFVAYGIGGPAVIITHPNTLAIVSETGNVGWIGWLFLTGVAAQVLLSFFNKVAMWYLYCGELNQSYRSTRRYKLADWFSEQFWVDLMLDLVTLLAFSISTVMLFQAFTRSVTTGA